MAGNVTHVLTHPRIHWDKENLVRATGEITACAIKRLQQGVDIGDGLTSPAQVVVNQITKGESLLTITIHEGRNRQVRRMIEAVGHTVKQLTRTRYDFLTLNGLKPGQYRTLQAAEVLRLKSHSRT